MLVDKFLNIPIQVIQFSTSSRVEVDYTSDANILKKAISKMKMIGAGTNMKDAFKVLRDNLVRNSLTKSTNPIVIFITDGTADNDPTAEAKALMSLVPAPKVVALAVGASANQGKLSAIFPGQYVYPISDFGMLDSLLKNLTVAQKTKSCIKMYMFPANKDLQTSKDNLTIDFSVEPEDPMKVIPIGSTISFPSNNYFSAESITLKEAAFQRRPVKASVTLEVKPAARAFGQFPSVISFECHINGSTKVYKGTCQFLIGYLAGDFIYKKNPKHPINILVWGPMGSGKSSLINGIIAMFSHQYKVKKILKISRRHDHVTKDYMCHRIADFADTSEPLGALIADNIKLNFWDPWGLTTSNYQNLKLMHFLEGRVPKDQPMNDSFSHHPVIEDQVTHAVVFMIPLGTALQKPLLDNLSKLIDTTQDFGIRPVVVVNFANQMQNQAEVEKQFKIILDASHLSKDDVIMMDNYEDEPYRIQQKDLQYWSLVGKLFEEATKNIKLRPMKPVTSSQCSGVGPLAPDLAALNICESLCRTTSCANFNKGVTTPCCAYCGNPPVDMRASAMVCGEPSCVDVGKAVNTPRCGQCGKPAVNKSAERVCSSSSCVNRGKTVQGNFCGHCGAPPSSESPSASPIKKNLCPSTTCPNGGQEIPKGFNYCAMCGALPSN
ncbi:hypothetical protein SAMD00019534_091000 [Acytostelium subglobosum LB1]|uniref:hypothetical protein n=1 Tax=Acytostelium subglobosum LB1 TaxID=1410327 RepID=UPI000644B254|nr:hypothetical protein SAMD00019534_091000 [Acytostelium subglobosum LB1]GAM25925.1 hypothetical protein SAMD00019534_091000 [Acytostelium subglobosum LB1]|eukprot:XP_012750968.1 hypothetical protein SAMD00019534_091000 [Acytostelium subglobosum LB1]